MIFLKQATAYTAKIGPFLDETDGKTVEGGLTITQAEVRLSKNGGNLAQKNEATNCTHDELGYYDCPLDVTDTDTLGKLQLFVHEAGALPVWHDFHVLPANVYDSMFSTDKLEVDVAQWLGTAAATPTVAGVPEVDVTHWIGTAAATPTTAGVPEVDLTHIAGAAVATGTAQLGVNVVSVTNDAITAAAIANGAIDAATFAAGAITAAAIATDAIDADALAADAVTEICNLSALAYGTAQAGSTYYNIILAAGSSAVNDFYTGNLIEIVSGVGAGQSRLIIDYVGASKIAVVSNAWATAPTNTSVYRIWPFSRILMADSGLSTAWGASTITLAATASAIADTYVGHTIYITSGTGVGQARLITAYSAIRVATVSPAWTTVPDATSTYFILPVGRVYVNQIAGDAIDAASIKDGAIDSAAFAAGAINAAAIATGAIDADAFATDAIDEIADGVWDEATSGHVAVGTFGQRLAIIRSGAAQDGAAATITLDAGASAVNDFYNYNLIVITGGTGVGQCRTISDYDGGTKIASITPDWGTNPALNSIFTILPVGYVAGASAPTAAQVADAVWDEATADHVAVGTFGQRLGILRASTATGGGNLSITLDAGASAVNDFYLYSLVIITGGAGVGQCRTIAGYDGGTKIATITPAWGTNPAAGSVYAILPVGYVAGATAPTVDQIADAVWAEIAEGIESYRDKILAIDDYAAVTKKYIANYIKVNKTTGIYTLYDDASGVELCPSPTCAVDFFDSLGVGWTHDVGNTQYDCDGTQVADSDLTEAGICTSGVTYRVEFVISNYSAGNLCAVCGTEEGTDRAADGTWVDYILADGTDFIMRADATFVGSIDSISIQSVAVLETGTIADDGTLKTRTPDS